MQAVQMSASTKRARLGFHTRLTNSNVRHETKQARWKRLVKSLAAPNDASLRLRWNSILAGTRVPAKGWGSPFINFIYSGILHF